MLFIQQGINAIITPTINSPAEKGQQHREDETGDLVVIGAGLPRTGTTSTQLALEMLYGREGYVSGGETVISARKGGRKVYHMRELIQNDHTTFFIDWKETREKSSDEIRQQFKDYACTLDVPACMFWEELLSEYPNAKVLLTVRDAEGWFKSCNETLFASQPGNRYMWWGCWIVHMVVPYFRKHHKMLWLAWGGPHFGGNYDAETVKRAMVSWNASVIAKCPKDKLLVFNVKQGWEPLCKFLGVPTPDVPFPNANDSAAMKKLQLSKNYMGYLILAVSCAGLGGLVAAIRMAAPFLPRLFENKR